MTQYIRYSMTINAPDEIDADTLAEIERDAEPHDETQYARIQRWLGGEINQTENALASVLPDGWSVTITEEG